MAHAGGKRGTSKFIFLDSTAQNLYIYSAQITNYSNSVFASHEAADPVEERREEELDSSKLPREMPRQATVFI